MDRNTQILELSQTLIRFIGSIGVREIWGNEIRIKNVRVKANQRLGLS